MQLQKATSGTSRRKEAIKLFLDRYSRDFNKVLSGVMSEEKIISAFADCIIEANPLGIDCGEKRSSLNAEAKASNFYRKIGINSIHIEDNLVMLVNSDHSIAKVKWRFNYSKDRHEGYLLFDMVYFIKSNENIHKIFAFIAGDAQKEIKALTEPSRGLEV